LFSIMSAICCLLLLHLRIAFGTPDKIKLSYFHISRQTSAVKHWHYSYNFLLKMSVKSQKCLLCGILHYLMYVVMYPKPVLFISAKVFVCNF